MFFVLMICGLTCRYVKNIHTDLALLIMNSVLLTLFTYFSGDLLWFLTGRIAKVVVLCFICDFNTIKIRFKTDLLSPFYTLIPSELFVRKMKLYKKVMRN